MKVVANCDRLIYKSTGLPKGQYFCYTFAMTAYQKIYEVAADNYGFITTKEAAALGVPKSEMSALAKRNRLVRHGYGVYRLATHYQPSEFDSYAEAVMLVGEGAAVWGESVLAMHETHFAIMGETRAARTRRNGLLSGHPMPEARRCIPFLQGEGHAGTFGGRRSQGRGGRMSEIGGSRATAEGA